MYSAGRLIVFSIALLWLPTTGALKNIQWFGWPCSETLFCDVEAGLSCQKGICGCPFGSVFSKDKGRCFEKEKSKSLKGNVISVYGDTCSDSVDCDEEEGMICKNAVCVCPAGTQVSKDKKTCLEKEKSRSWKENSTIPAHGAKCSGNQICDKKTENSTSWEENTTIPEHGVKMCSDNQICDTKTENLTSWEENTTIPIQGAKCFGNQICDKMTENSTNWKENTTIPIQRAKCSGNQICDKKPDSLHTLPMVLILVVAVVVVGGGPICWKISVGRRKCNKKTEDTGGPLIEPGAVV